MWKLTILLSALVFGVYGRVEEGDIQYHLWNRAANGQRIFPNNFGTSINRNAPVKLLIHGWTQSIKSFWYDGTRQNYVASGANVIKIDWSRHSQLTYGMAISRLPAIGDFIAQFLIGLSRSQGIPMSQIHLIGHSLGAHLSGFTGKSIRLRSGQSLGRITGLDPAGPSFTNSAPSNRLDRTDANQVDTILTDAGLAGLGINESLGHVNFWPNGGTATQPGCLYYPCSHNRAPRFFEEGVSSDLFIATQCSSYREYSRGNCNGNPRNILGESTNHRIQGEFYLTTNRRSPFAQG